MSIRLKPKQRFEDTVVGKVTNNIAALKVRNNITIQQNKISNSNNVFLKNKGSALFSARIEIREYS